MNNEIDKIFEPDFDITKVDPMQFDTSFIITAILHDHKHLIHLDPYLNESQLDIIMQILLVKNVNHLLYDFLRNIRIMPKTEYLLLSKLKNGQTLLGDTKMLFFSWTSHSYKKQEAEGIVNIEMTKNHFMPAFSVAKYCMYLIDNNTITYPLLKEMENYYLPEIEKYEMCNSSNSGTYEWGKHTHEEYIWRLETIRNHKNYSTAKHILEKINSETLIK